MTTSKIFKVAKYYEQFWICKTKAKIFKTEKFLVLLKQRVELEKIILRQDMYKHDT